MRIIISIMAVIIIFLVATIAIIWVSNSSVATVPTANGRTASAPTTGRNASSPTRQLDDITPLSSTLDYFKANIPVQRDASGEYLVLFHWTIKVECPAECEISATMFLWDENNDLLSTEKLEQRMQQGTHTARAEVLLPVSKCERGTHISVEVQRRTPSKGKLYNLRGEGVVSVWQ